MNPEEGYMRKALGLARLGQGKVQPNPMVGAVVVSMGKVIGTGYHSGFGGPHAEINALKAAGPKARGATIYVTLQPCNTFGKTPPCTDALIKAGVRKVVYACSDPLQSSSQKDLLAYGIEVEHGLLEKDALDLNAPYFKLVNTGLPYVTAKWAMTLDGRVTIPRGEERWVSSELSRAHVQRLRGLMDVIMLGIGTVLKDDPELTCRIATPRKPKRVILDSKARIPLHSTLVRTTDIAELAVATTTHAPPEKLRALEKADCQVIICSEKDGRVDLPELMEKLAAEKATNVLLEGGPTLFATAFREGLVDKVITYIAGKIVGDDGARSAIEQPIQRSVPIHLEKITHERFGNDLMMVGLVPDSHRDLRPRSSAASEQTPAADVKE